ncbi:MAG: DUF1178 family protein [Pseudomonadota bacterium]
MIKYALSCDQGHKFDGWFKDSGAFEDQVSAGLVTCPYCESDKIQKVLMAPAVTGSKKSRSEDWEGQSEVSPGPTPVPQPPAVSPAGALVQGDETMKAVVSKIQELRNWVTENAENVGNRFADEARKIHYGEEDPRGIYGSATSDEAHELVEEGVAFLPLPALPEEKN